MANKPRQRTALIWEEGIGPLGTFEAEMAGGGRGSYYHIHPVTSLRKRGDINRGDIVAYQIWAVLRDKRGRKTRLNLGDVPTFQQAKEFCERDYAERKD